MAKIAEHTTANSNTLREDSLMISLGIISFKTLINSKHQNHHSTTNHCIINHNNKTTTTPTAHHNTHHHSHQSPLHLLMFTNTPIQSKNITHPHYLHLSHMTLDNHLKHNIHTHITHPTPNNPNKPSHSLDKMMRPHSLQNKSS